MFECISCSRPLPSIADFAICPVCHEVRELLAFFTAPRRGAFTAGMRGTGGTDPPWHAERSAVARAV
eukprot:2304902-Alexandrium_andersonii.AAC.1